MSGRNAEGTQLQYSRGPVGTHYEYSNSKIVLLPLSNTISRLCDNVAGYEQPQWYLHHLIGH